MRWWWSLALWPAGIPQSCTQGRNREALGAARGKDSVPRAVPTMPRPIEQLGAAVVGWKHKLTW